MGKWKRVRGREISLPVLSGRLKHEFLDNAKRLEKVPLSTEVKGRDIAGII